MILTIQWRRGGTALWQDYVLLEGEPGYDSDLDIAKVGDGVTKWQDLPAIGVGGTGGGSIDPSTLRLDASQVISGVFDVERIPDLSGQGYVLLDANGKMASGLLPDLSAVYAKLDAGGLVPVAKIPALPYAPNTIMNGTLIKSTSIPDLSGSYAPASIVDESGMILASVLPATGTPYVTGTEVQDVQTDLDNFKTLVPTNEDLLCVYRFGGPNYSVDPNTATALTNGTIDYLMTAPYDITINGVDLVFRGAYAASDSTYWSFELAAYSGVSGPPVLALMSTQITGANANGSIADGVVYSFSGVPWTTTNLDQGESLRLRTFKTSGAASLPWWGAATVRYQRRTV